MQNKHLDPYLEKPRFARLSKSGQVRRSQEGMM